MKIRNFSFQKLFITIYVIFFTGSSALAISLILPVEEKFAEFLWSFENNGQPFRIDRDTYGLPGKPKADIRLLQAWSIRSQAPEIKIAVIDSQFDLEHPDLQSSFNIDHSWNFLTNQGPVLSPVNDLLPHHGTMVAGVIGADGMNLVGITGILRKSHLIPIEAVPVTGNENDDQIAQAIRFAVNQGARIINCSFGKYSSSKAVEGAIAWAQKNNVVIVTSVGNDGLNVDERPHWPSSYSVRFDNVISVAATNRNDLLTSDSNFGRTVDIAAPGHEVFTTGNPAKTISKYSSFSGTSAAAPHVTGVAGLMLSLNPQVKPREVKEILLQTSDPIENKNGERLQFGRLNAYRALQLVKQKMNTAFDAGDIKNCDGAVRKKEYLRSNSKIGYRWELSENSELFQSWQGQDPYYKNYREWVLSNNPGDFRAILQKHLEAGRRILSKINPNEDLAKRIIEDEKFVLEIIRGFQGKVVPINCIESLVFREFLKSNNNVKSKNEFMANVFQRGNRFIIFGEWDAIKNSDQGFSGAAESEELKSERSKLLSEGWHLYAHLHNHPFNFENAWGDVGGGLAPSDADLATYRALNPSLALITNGLETVRFDESLWNKNLRR